MFLTISINKIVFKEDTKPYFRLIVYGVTNPINVSVVIEFRQAQIKN